jgi:hydroxymethylpyrimidine/phosphomethylpyrimidine kinase
MSVHLKAAQEKTPRVLTITESDSRGASGIQGDVKTILALGGYAMTAITALTSHNAIKITPIQGILSPFVTEQLNAIAQEGSLDAIRIGFLHNEATINAVADFLERPGNKGIPVVVDPCIVSRSEKILMDNPAIAALKRRLYIHTTVLTPNLKEAEILGVLRISNIDDMRHAADMMRTLGVENVMLKGGRVENDKELYFVATPEEERIYQRPTIQTPHTLGAGNVLSSALAVNLAKQMDIFKSIEAALDFMHQTIVNSTGFGQENGSVNHAFHLENQPQFFHPEEIKIYKV